MGKFKMKFILAALLGLAAAGAADDDKLHFFDFDNAKMLYKGDWAAYKKSRPHDNDCSIAESDNWKVPNSALSPGSAEAPECAREEDGAPVSMDARDPHSQLRLQVSPTPTEQ